MQVLTMFSPKSVVRLIMVFWITAMAGCCDDDNAHHAISNQEFVNQASSYLNFELTAAALASDRTINPATMRYSELISRDHASTVAKFKNLADKTGWVVGDSVSQDGVEQLRQLRKVNNPGFESEYINLMLKSHQHALSVFQQASDPTGPPNADLRALAAEKLTVINEHIKTALICQKEMQQK